MFACNLIRFVAEFYKQFNFSAKQRMFKVGDGMSAVSDC